MACVTAIMHQQALQVCAADFFRARGLGVVVAVCRSAQPFGAVFCRLELCRPITAALAWLTMYVHACVYVHLPLPR